MPIDTLKTQLELNKLIAQQAKLQAKITTELKSQLSMTEALKTANMGGDIDDVVESLMNMRKALSDTGDAGHDMAKKNADAMKALSDAMEESSKRSSKLGDKIATMTEKFPVAAAAGVLAFQGLSQGLSNVTALAKAGISTFIGLGSALWDIGKSILALPFDLLGGLVQMANDMPGSTAWAETREAIRDEYGSFAEDISRTIMDMYDNLDGTLAETGLSVWRVLGNRAEQLRAVQELAQGMGNTFHLFRDELLKNSEAIIAYQRGLGVSNEQMKFIADNAKEQGRTLTDTLNMITVAAVSMSDAFDMSHKVISKDIVQMTQDVGNFGTMTFHEMARASVYVRKLGLEIKDVIGIISAYDNFEDATKGAAQLAQAFGANVDALAMMREQDPTKRLDMLRKSMAAAGVDARNLSRQELKLLSQQVGLDEATTKMAFSLKNQGMSMAELERQQAKNEKKTMTQQEAMVQLADSIKLLVKQGRVGGGFLTHFLKGFERGLKWSGAFWQLMKNIRMSLRAVYWQGVRVGRMFIEHFPGVKTMIKALSDFFEPERFKKLMKKVVNVFGDFFRNLTEDPKTALPKLLDRLRKTFFSFFDSSSSMGSKFLSGLERFSMTMSNIFAGFIRIASESLTKLFTFIADVLTGKVSLTKPNMSGPLGAFMKLLHPILEAIEETWEPLVASLKRLALIAFEKLKDALAPYSKYIMMSLASVIVAPAVVNVVVGAITGKMFKLAGQFMKRRGGRGLGIPDGLGRTPKAGEFAKGVEDGMSKGTGVVKSGADMAKALEKVDVKKVGPGKIARFGAILAALSAALLVGGVALAGTLVVMKKILSDMSRDDIITMGSLIGGFGLLVGALAVPMSIVSKVGKQVLIGFTFMAAAMPILAAGAGAAIWLLKKIDIPDPKKLSTTASSLRTIMLSTAMMIPVAVALGAAVLNPIGPMVLMSALAGFPLVGVFATEMIGSLIPAVRSMVEASRQVGDVTVFKATAETMTGIITAVVDITKVMGDIIDDIKPGLFEFTNRSEKMRDNINSLKGFMESMIGDSGSGLVGMLSTIRTFITNVSEGDVAEQNGRFVSLMTNTLTAVTSMITALKPSDAFMSAVTSTLSLDSASDINEGLNSLAVYIENLSHSLTGPKGPLNNIKNFLSSLSSIGTDVISESSLKIVKGVGDFLSFIGPLVKSLQPPKSFFEATGGLFDDDLEDALDGYTKYFTRILPMLSSVVESAAVPIQELTTSLMKGLSGVIFGVDKEQLRGMSDMFGSVLGPTIGMIGKLLKFQVETSKDRRLWESQGAGADAFSKLANVISGMGGDIATFARSIIAVAQDVAVGSNVSSVKSGVSIIGSTIDVLMKFTETFGNMLTLDTKLSKVPRFASGVSGGLGSGLAMMSNVVANMFSSSGKRTSPIEKLINSIKSMPKLSRTDRRALNTNIDTLKSISTATKDMTDLFVALQPWQNNDNILGVATGDIPAVKVVHGMVEAVNMMNAELSNLKVIELKPRLKGLARALGVNEKYTITNEKININIKLDVRMDAQDVAAGIADGRWFQIDKNGPGRPHRRPR